MVIKISWYVSENLRLGFHHLRSASKMSNSSREYSPDWLRNVQAPPTASILTLSSSSESVMGGDFVSEDEKDDQLPISSVIKKTSQVKSPDKKLTKRNRFIETEGSKVDRKVAKGKTPEKPTKTQETKSSDWSLPSDSEHQLSEQETGQILKEEAKDDDVSDAVEESSHKGTPKKRPRLEAMVPPQTKGKNVTKQDDDNDLKGLERETTEKHTGSYISSSRLPLVLSDKVQRSKALVECEGESIDLSGDLGSVGRVIISDAPSGSEGVLLDLKGTIYKTTILPSRTFCVVSFGQSEAKIEAIMNDFLQLKPESNVYEAETMVEGTLEGFSFDSEDEADNRTIRQTEQNEGNQTLTNGKGKGKAEKTSIQGAARKKGKAAVKKPEKKVKRKAPAAKRSKAKK